MPTEKIRKIKPINQGTTTPAQKKNNNHWPTPMAIGFWGSWLRGHQLGPHEICTTCGWPLAMGPMAQRNLHHLWLSLGNGHVGPKAQTPLGPACPQKNIRKIKPINQGTTTPAQKNTTTGQTPMAICC